MGIDLLTFALAKKQAGSGSSSGIDDLTLSLELNDETYEMTLGLKKADGTILSTQSVDLPIESMIIGASYADGAITLKLQNGTTLDPIRISDLVSGLLSDSLTVAGLSLKDSISKEALSSALEIDGLNSKIADLEKRIAELESGSKTSAEQIQALQENYAEQNEKIAGMVPNTFSIAGISMADDITVDELSKAIGVDSLTTQVGELQAADTELSAKITENTEAIESEATRATNAEEGIGTKITSLEESISTESERAKGVEEGFDTRIGDLSDIVNENVDVLALNLKKDQEQDAKLTSLEGADDELAANLQKCVMKSDDLGSMNFSVDESRSCLSVDYAESE